MHIVSSEDLSVKQVYAYSKDRIVFDNKLLNRGPSFSKKLKQAAINFCQESEQAKLFHLIVESSSHVTIWIEDEHTMAREWNRYSPFQSSRTTASKQQKEKKVEDKTLPKENYSGSLERQRVETLARQFLQKGHATDSVIQKLMQDRFFKESQEKVGSERTLQIVSKLVGNLVTEILLKKLKSSYTFIKN